jgi:aldose sugar dehydrogenase
MRNVAPAIAATALALTTLAASGPALAVDKVYKTEKAEVRVTTFADGLTEPWGLAALPDGGFLVTEKKGDLHYVTADGKLSEPLKGVPKVDDRGQGGLLDVALDPEFQRNRLVYISYSEPGEGGANSTAVARGVLSADGGALSDVRVIFSQKPKVRSTKHFGSRLVFDRQGHLFIGLGERSEEQFRTQA